MSGIHEWKVTVTSHNRHGISNHRQLDCLSTLFGLATKEISNAPKAVQMTGNAIVCSGSQQRKHESLAFLVLCGKSTNDWWFPPMMKSSNGNIFRVTGHLGGEFTGPRPVTQSFDVFFDLSPNKRLSKHWWGWWFDTPSRPLWRHCNDTKTQWCVLLCYFLC